MGVVERSVKGHLLHLAWCFANAFLAPILRLRSGRGPAAILFAKTPAQVLLGIPVGIPAHLKLFGCWDSKKLDLVYQKPSEDDD